MPGRNKSFVLRGIVISTTPHGEADSLVTLFTKENGKITLLAKGSRKMKSKKRSSLQMFSDISFQYIETGGLGLMTEAKLINHFGEIRNDLGKVSLAYFFCEVIKKITPENVTQPEIYNLLYSAMKALEKTTKLRILKESFIQKILLYAGFSTEESSDPVKFLEQVLERELGSVRVGRMIQ